MWLLRFENHEAVWHYEECVAMAPVNEQDRRKLRHVSIDLLKCEEMQKELEKFKALMETAVGRKLRYFHS